jgi:surfeit locus 1 family protein
MKFRPSFKLTLILITLAAVFLRLGLWQLDRKAEKVGLFLRFEQAPTMGIGQALALHEEWTRVKASGRYDPVRHLLLDNKVWNGRAGVQALTPFRLDDGRWVLVNRGWLPLPPDRRSLPEIPTDPGQRTIHGRLVAPASGGLRLGGADVLAADRWPQLVTYLNLANAGEALGEALEPWVVQLDADDPSGFGDRQWAAAVMGPAVHAAYAVQWLALSATSIIIWIALGLRRGRRAGSAPRPGRGDQPE